MNELLGRRVAVLVMGSWVRRADALLQDGALANAARAVQEHNATAQDEALTPASGGHC